MAPKGLYSVQKSRSFGGTNNFNNTPPKDIPLSPDTGRKTPNFEGRKTPNFDSLRKKFSRKKTTSFDDDDGDYIDGSSSSTLKKKNKGPSKVGNIFKWFRKDSKDQEPIYEHDNLTPKITRLIQKQNEEPRIISVNPKPFRSSSYDSICSVGSAASSFAFVPVNAYKVGKYVEPKKKIAIGISCGQETYRKRLEQRDNGLENDKELTLKTKYNLMSSDSPPTLVKNNLPAGPLLQSSELHRNDDTNSSSSEDSDDTVELESISQRCSPARQWSGPEAALAALSSALTQPSEAAADQQRGQNKNTADNKNAAAAAIKPRELTGQILHPMTIKPGNIGVNQQTRSDGSDCGTLRYVSSSPSRPQIAKFAHLSSVSAQSAQTQNNSGSGKESEILPKNSTAEALHSVSVFHYPRSSSSNNNNPFGDSVSSSSPATSPRTSISEDSDNKPSSHIPGKRKAPEPPPRTQSPDSKEHVTNGNSSNNQIVKKKGKAPQPPSDKEANTRSNSLENGFSACLAGGQVKAGNSRPDSRQQADQIKNNCVSLSQQRMTGSAPTSPISAKKFPNNPCGDNSNEWVLQNGLLKCIRESQQDLIEASCGPNNQDKDVKVPLSPKPWYKRNIVKESLEKKGKEKQKAKSPDNLPENHTGREGFKIKDSFEEKYGFAKQTAKESPSEAPKSPKMFLRNKIMPSSPKTERPNSRPISGLTGISDLDRQAAEIIRRKNEDEAARRKADDEKFYASNIEAEGLEAQQAIDNIMDKVSKKMKNNIDSKASKEVVNSSNNVESKSVPSKENKIVKKEVDIETDFQSMGNVVSDLNSFLASTRKAMSSPHSQKRIQQQQKPVQPNGIDQHQQASQQVNMNVANQHQDDNKSRNRINIQNLVNENHRKVSSSVNLERKSNDNVARTNAANSGNTLSSTDQKPNYFPPTKLVESNKTNLPPPPTPAMDSTTKSDRSDWSCHRCTLINIYSALSCEVCGARRCDGVDGSETFKDQDLDNDSEDAPPKPGNVLNKLVLFSSMDAKSKETPSLQRRKSADINKLSRTYSTAAMLPIDENPLQKTLERIAEKQAELGKTKECFSINNFTTSKDANIEKCKSNTSSCQETKSNQFEMLKQQQKLLEEANLNLSKQSQLEEKLLLNEKTSTLPFGDVSAKYRENKSNLNEIPVVSDNSNNNSNLIMKSPSVIIPSQSNKEAQKFPRNETEIASSLKGSFDFTKTPGSFLSSSKISQPTPKPWSKFGHEDTKSSIKAAPKLEFLGSEVTRKTSEQSLDAADLRQARLEFFSANNETVPTNHGGDISTTPQV